MVRKQENETIGLFAKLRFRVPRFGTLVADTSEVCKHPWTVSDEVRCLDLKADLMKEALYIDIPFATGLGGDLNRSRFIWGLLSEHYTVDLVLTLDGEEAASRVDDHEGYRDLLTLDFKPGTGFQPHSVFHFSEDSFRQLREFVSGKSYAVIVIRAAAPALLGEEIRKVDPNAKVVIDSDLVMSKYTQGIWENSRTIKNRWSLFESWRLKKFEKQLYQKDYLFLFANSEDDRFIREQYVNASTWKGKTAMLPNAVRFDVGSPTPPQGKSFLYFGALDSKPNIDAFVFLMDEVYPHMADALAKHGATLDVAGRRVQPIYQELVEKHGAGEHVRILGEVDDMTKTIMDASFSVFPVQNGTGTRVRVLDAAKARRTAVTTSKGAEGYEMGEDALFIRDDAADYAKAVVKLLEEPDLAIRMGENLFEKAHHEFSEESVGEALLKSLGEWSEA